MDRLEAEVRAQGLTVFARIDHAAGAAVVGLPLQPTEVLIFCNARGGTPLMDANQSVGIEREMLSFGSWPRRPPRHSSPRTCPRCRIACPTSAVRGSSLDVGVKSSWSPTCKSDSRVRRQRIGFRRRHT